MNMSNLDQYRKLNICQAKRKFAGNLKLSYDDPILVFGGWKTHLFDEWGRPYLDAYNNVPHVGHSHPRIQNIASEQLRKLNSNTRYLTPKPIRFSRNYSVKITRKF